MRNWMKVSVVTPTHGRPRSLELVYQLFDAQTHPDKELLIEDDSPEPNAFMARLADPRVRYRHQPTRATLGAKRATLGLAAHGDVIAHFDDDDYYAPGYLTRMLVELEGHDLVTLSQWFLFDVKTRGLFYWDTTQVLPVHFRVEAAVAPRAIAMQGLGEGRAEWVDRHLWGYGFSYVYRRDLCQVARFDPTLEHGEDVHFVRAAQAAGGRVRAVPDERGLVLHVVHDGNTASVFPNYRLPPFLLHGLFGDGALGYLRAAGQI
jgi:glycosyltransferase involved in cell wall biosynthesis